MASSPNTFLFKMYLLCFPFMRIKNIAEHYFKDMPFANINEDQLYGLKDGYYGKRYRLIVKYGIGYSGFAYISG